MTRLAQIDHGSSLLEAVIAAGLLATVLTGVLPLVSLAASGAATSRANLMARQLARQRVAQLQALTWARTSSGVTVDVQTRARPEGYASDGSGLVPTGTFPLTGDVEGWHEWLDAGGSAVTGPSNARFRRRWGILAGPGADCVQLWVVVSPWPATTGMSEAHAGALRCAWGVATP